MIEKTLQLQSALLECKEWTMGLFAFNIMRNKKQNIKDDDIDKPRANNKIKNIKAQKLKTIKEP